MSSHYYCPACWAEMDQWDRQCPRCGYDLSSYANLPYEEKLIDSLKHPIRENRMIAIQILGDLRSEMAVPFLATLLKTEEDYYIIREIVLSLRKIGNEESMNLIQKLKDHPSVLVRRLIEDKK